jgi:hypothetical protein
MAEIAYSGQIPAARMQQVVAHCHFAQGDALFMAEQIPAHFITSKQERDNLLQFTHFNSDLSCAEYTSGRIFQEDRELRWEKQGDDTLRVVYIGSAEHEGELRDDQLQPYHAFNELKKQSEPTYYYLFGERLRHKDSNRSDKALLAGDFAVLRIPRTLSYPVPPDNKRYARLAVCEYLEAGRVALFRFQRLETWSGKE